MAAFFTVGITVLTTFFIALPSINIGINWLLNFETIRDFLNVVAFVLPWQNLGPLISLIIAFFVFRIIVAVIKTIWELIPMA